MDKEFFLNAAIPPALHFEPMSSLPVSSWQSLELNFPAEQPRDCYLNHNWEQSMEQNIHFDSALSSLVSSPVAPSNSNISNDNFVLRELIGKLVNIGDSGEISPQSRPLLRRNTAPMTTAAYNISGNNSTNTSCYNTPLNSPPSKQQNSPIMDQLVKQKLSNMEHTTTPLNSTLTELSGDPGFAERAARFSCFGSRSFNGRTSQIESNSTEFSCRSNPIMGNGKLARVSSTPSLQMIGSQLGFQENKKPPMQERTEMRLNSPIPISRSSGSSAPDQTEFANSYEQSPLSEQIPGGESGPKAPNDSNSRKRKAAPRGKSKELAQSQSTKAIKVTESERESNPKRCRMTEAGENENSTVKTEAEQKGNATTDEDENQTKSNQKPPEPSKDYIHVRARRGQATDSHSLAERVRREKISERMKLLQDLVPGCNKVTGKALMLDEIINYVQSLQRQVEFLSMKLASLDFETEDSHMETHLSKDLYQSNSHSQHPAYPVDSSTSTVYGHHHLQRPILQSNRSTGAVSQCSVELLDSVQYRNLGTQLPPPIDGFGEGIPQFAALCEDDLQSLVQMGFGKNLNQEAAFQSHSLQGSNQTSQMKSEF